MGRFRGRILSAVMLAQALASAASAEMGDYLAARSAAAAHDYEVAARHYMALIEDGAATHAIYENALAAHLAAGDLDGAVAVALMMKSERLPSQVAALVRQAEAARVGDWDGIFMELEAGHQIGPLVDGLAQGWAHVGKGEVDEGLAAFDAVIAVDGLRPFGLYHKALALAVVGDMEGAEAIFELPPSEGMLRTRRTVLAHARVLAQLGRHEEALELMERAFGDRSDPGVAALRASLAAEETPPFDFLTGPRDGMAEIYLTVGGAIEGEVNDAYTLFYARAAAELRPNLTEAHLMAARLLESLGRYDLAHVAYDAVPQDDPAFIAAEIGRARALDKAGETAVAIEVLTRLTERAPDEAAAFSALGDILRRENRMAEARDAYSRAIEETAPGDPRLWRLHFTRAVTLHEDGLWPAAEADLRRSLQLSPDQAAVLNYLGYGLVDRGEKLDEALSLIERAVSLEPENGAIVDSLGWALFQLGDYEEAVARLEQAVELDPVSSVINDHLGDAYWIVGRRDEARFQWMRALSFLADASSAEAVTIRTKLDRGLDLAGMPAGDGLVTLAQDRP